eukprot:4031116-Amphidinium_carterae.1
MERAVFAAVAAQEKAASLGVKLRIGVHEAQAALKAQKKIRQKAALLLGPTRPIQLRPKSLHLQFSNIS